MERISKYKAAKNMGQIQAQSETIPRNKPRHPHNDIAALLGHYKALKDSNNRCYNVFTRNNTRTTQPGKKLDHYGLVNKYGHGEKTVGKASFMEWLQQFSTSSTAKATTNGLSRNWCRKHLEQSKCKKEAKCESFSSTNYANAASSEKPF